MLTINQKQRVMKKYLLLFISLCLTLNACNTNNKPEKYKSFKIQGTKYTVSALENYAVYRQAPGMITLAYQSGSIQYIATIMKTNMNVSQFHQVAEGEVDTYRDKFTPNEQQNTDSVIYYTFSKGIFSSRLVCFLKKVGNQNFYCSFTSIAFDECSKIANSIKLSINSATSENEEVAKVSQKKITLKSYSSSNFSVSYPSSWKVQQNVDEVTDVYIGSTTGAIGFTILHFPTDYTLNEINDEGKNNLIQSGAKILEDSKVTVSGVPCYEQIIEMPYNGQTYRQISYTLKKGDYAYNIKFGNDTKWLVENKNLVKDIVRSLKFRK
jgi:hypothetical protein